MFIGGKIKVAIKIIALVFAFCVLLNLPFNILTHFHNEKHQGLEYYMDNSYSDFGYIVPYGRIAMQYLPKYADIADGAVYMDFFYDDGGCFFNTYVYTWVGARYEHDVYLQKRSEIVDIGEDFGRLGAATIDAQFRLVKKKMLINGISLYYLVSYSDNSDTIFHLVFFDHARYDSMFDFECYTMMTCFDAWDDLYPLYHHKGTVHVQ